MKSVLRIVSYLALAALVICPLAFITDGIEKATMITAMLVATIAWFGSAPFWMGKTE